MLGRWRKRGEKNRARKHRHADPRELVEEDGVVMSGPAGAPQEGESVAERRARDRADRAH
jgi:hypothetical protein